MNDAKLRKRMVDEQIRARGVRDPRVLAAMDRVPRHRFVDEALESHAYEDKALPIGDKQTISQPYMVALMTEAVELQGHERVLEIGAGSGYQTAILAELSEQVFAIERVPRLAQMARKRLEALGIYNALVQVGDGTIGWNEHAPFDGILVAAGAPTVPRALLDQLAVGGRLVLPVGDESVQVLIRVRRTPEGFEEENLGQCRFVKLVGRQGWEG